jgi:hypothetical protein
MSYERMLDKDSEPTQRDISKWMGKGASLWSDLRAYLLSHYDHVPQVDFGGKKYGWSIRYRKGGKTLVTLFPERGAFTALVVLGGKETARAQATTDELSPRVRRLFQETEQLRDGRWLWIRPSSKADVESIKALVSTKRQPKPSVS